MRSLNEKALLIGRYCELKIELARFLSSEARLASHYYGIRQAEVTLLIRSSVNYS